MSASRNSRRLSRRRLVQTGGAGIVTGFAMTGPASIAAAQSGTPVAEPDRTLPLPSAIMAVMEKPRYSQSTWSLLVADVATGEMLYELNPDKLSFTGSVRKLYSVGLGLQELGADHRFTTPVYRQGAVDAQGVLTGDLILEAAGDLTFGGRLNADGTIAITDFDHNDANNLGTAILPLQDPLHGLDSLAQQVRESGIGSVTGDVVIDDRLFDHFRSPNQQLLITPMTVNENMVDVTVTPTQDGQAAILDWRPQTEAFRIDGTVTTTAVGTPATASLSNNGLVECIGTDGCSGTVEGDIPADYQAPLSGSSVWVRTFRIEDPASFARTAFIEALNRAGVTVDAVPVATNPNERLPAPGSYSADSRVAEFVSPPYSEYARLILKVSLNLGANLSLMLLGHALGHRTVIDALAAERQVLVDELGLPADGFDFPTNGSGSPDSQATPRATVRLLVELGSRDADRIYQNALPILGVDGSLASAGVSLPARGHVYAKTGTTLMDGMLKAQNLAGYIEAKSGRRLAFALFLNDAGPIEAISDVTEVFEDEAVITNAIYESA